MNASEITRTDVIKAMKCCQMANQSEVWCREQGCPFLRYRADGDCVGRLHMAILDPTLESGIASADWRGPTGEWRKAPAANRVGWRWKCSHCKGEALQRTDHCSWCGALMLDYTDIT